MKNDPPDTLLLDMKKDSPESLLLHSLELDIPTAQAELAGNTLDREQMVWRRKRGGLLQPHWVNRIINPFPKMIWHQNFWQKKIQKTDLEQLIGYMMRLVREKEKEQLRLRSLRD